MCKKTRAWPSKNSELIANVVLRYPTSKSIKGNPLVSYKTIQINSTNSKNQSSINPNVTFLIVKPKSNLTESKVT